MWKEFYIAVCLYNGKTRQPEWAMVSNLTFDTVKDARECADSLVLVRYQIRRLRNEEVLFQA